jgi:hypothetical protein
VLKKLIYLFFLLNTTISLGQKNLDAIRLTVEPNIDGQLKEPFWNTLPTARDFTQIEPDAGAKSTDSTVVKIGYDNSAIYIGAICYAYSNTVSRVLSQRDSYNSNTDYFSVLFDTYDDDLNGFVFSVSTEGVQYDAKIYSNQYNSKLNMIWYSRVHHFEGGFEVEIKIPFGALRFSAEEIQDWGVNFTRYISENREEASWNPIKPDLDNVVTQAGTLKGLQGLEPPLRLFFSPYLSTYVEHYPVTNDFRSNLSHDLNGGMDIKYGINEAFTLDMTLVPDFGQVVTDNVVLNLTPFEVFFDENRPFFNEGTELFEKTDHFYSRRVGGTPINLSNIDQSKQGSEKVISRPTTTPLLNASKLSGRTKNGLGIGLFNGLTGPQFAILEDSLTRDRRNVQVAPLSNYNVFVLDKNLKNNSSVTFTNTNVWRAGSTYEANVTALSSELNTKDNKYFVTVDGALSQKYASANNEFGHNFGVGLGKQTGRLTYDASYSELSNTYDPNDLGFLFNNNERSITTNIGYRIYKPFWKLNRLWSDFSNSYSRLYRPDEFIGLNYSGQLGVTSKKFDTYIFNFNGIYTPRKDFFEPRSEGYFFEIPVYFQGGVSLSSNYQKAFALDASVDTRNYSNTSWTDLSYRVSPRFRIGNHIFIIYSFRQNYNTDQRGYAIPFIGEQPESEGPIFGQRDVVTTTNTLDFRYTINNRSGITMRLRHYWSTVNYDKFFELNLDGTLSETVINETTEDGLQKYNTSFNAFSIDMVYRWIFSPASELNIVWKNNIFTENSEPNLNFMNNLDRTLQADQLNSISLRIVYFLDYQQIKKALSNRRKKGNDN